VVSLMVTEAEDGYNLDFESKTVKEWYRSFLLKGFTPFESANLVAKMMGLESSPSWTLKQLQKLDFMRHKPVSS